MNVQLVSFALVPDHIYTAEKYFHTDKLILILSEENKEKMDETSLEVEFKIKEIQKFYEKLNVSTDLIYVDYKDFMQMTSKLVKLLKKFSNDDFILLNLSGGRRSIPIALIYAGIIISNFKRMNIKCVVIPEDKSYTPFDLLPKYFPDEIDIKLMSKITENLTLTDLEDFLKIKQPTISIRLKKLEEYGYVIVKGRNRDLTDLGKVVVNIISPD
ncbi:MAG: ArsR family transcriptional regulator [Promethearchaeota archaeon]|nr:MAG: ArsR family transcriptional regulator [Candidatus Lokiarchaeota archaeon]